MDQQPNINLNYLTREMRKERDREIRLYRDTLPKGDETLHILTQKKKYYNQKHF